MSTDPLDGLRDDVSPADVEAAMTPAGGWTKRQLAEWGVPWPPPSSWKARLASNYRRRGGDAPSAAGHLTATVTATGEDDTDRSEAAADKSSR